MICAGHLPGGKDSCQVSVGAGGTDDICEDEGDENDGGRSTDGYSASWDGDGACGFCWDGVDRDDGGASTDGGGDSVKECASCNDASKCTN